MQLMRALRVIRLFGRIRALKKMATAVTASIFPMMNAFVILLIVVSICAASCVRVSARVRAGACVCACACFCVCLQCQSEWNAGRLDGRTKRGG